MSAPCARGLAQGYNCNVTTVALGEYPMHRLWPLGFLGLLGLQGYPSNPGLYGLFGLFALFALRPRPQSAIAPFSAAEPRGRDPLQFSLRTMLVVVAVVSAYLAGRASHQVHFSPGQAWQTQVRGFTNAVTILDQHDGRVRFFAPNSAFNGTYEWRDGKLQVVAPADRRMKGLTWARSKDGLELIAEPPDFPTGASYVGAKLTRKN